MTSLNDAIDSEVESRPLRRGWAFSVLRWVIGAVLLAAALKAVELSTRPAPDLDLLSYRWSLTAVVLFEIALGAWLLSGLARRLVWLVTLGCFGFFSVVTLGKALAGEPSCGCFGVVQVNPWHTLVLDLSIVVALLVLRPRLSAPVPAPARRWRVALGGAAVLAGWACSLAFISRFEPAQLGADGQVIGPPGQVVLLEPDRWLGRPLPLLKYTSVDKQLREGDWRVVLYHHDCPHCRQRIGEYDRQARTDRSVRFALLAMPPYGRPEDSPVPKDTTCLTGRVADTHDWFAVTPLELRLSAGKVLEVGGRGRRQQSVGGLVLGLSQVEIAQLPIVKAGAQRHSLGFVKPQSRYVIEYPLGNPASQSWRAGEALSECQCMAVLKSPREIPAGGTATAQVLFVAPDERLHYRKRVLLPSADPRQPPVELWLEAQVGLPLELQPQLVELTAGGDGLEQQGQVRLVNHGDKPVRPLYATSGSNWCIARIPALSAPPGGSVAIPIVARPAAGATSAQSATIRIHTDCADQPFLEALVSLQPSQTAAGAGPALAGPIAR